MAKSTTKEKCFIIMPITTPTTFIERYKDDDDHFNHVLQHLFIPALNEAGFEPVPPKAEGSNIIHADIIKQLSECELVLCDMSILNPNVFYEFGIRTALDKPVALVVDDKTKPIPFDTGIINFHKYDSSLAPWTLEDQKKQLTKHIKDAYKKSKNHNALWKYFGVTQTGTFKPEEAELGEKVDLIMKKLSTIETQQETHARLRKSLPLDEITRYRSITIHPVESETRILEKLIEGKGILQIAKDLNLSRTEVTRYLRKIRDRVGADSFSNLRHKIIAGEIDVDWRS